MCNLCLQIGNLAVHRLHIGVVGRVECLQVLFLLLQVFQFLLSIVNRNHANRSGVLLLALQRAMLVSMKVSFSCMSVHRLRARVQLPGKRLKGAFVRGLLIRQSSDVFALKVRELCVLLVQICLGIGKLLFQEVLGALCGFLPGIEVFADKERGDLSAHLLRSTRIRGLERDIEARNAARAAVDWRDANRFLGLLRRDRPSWPRCLQTG